MFTTINIKTPILVYYRTTACVCDISLYFRLIDIELRNRWFVYIPEFPDISDCEFLNFHVKKYIFVTVFRLKNEFIVRIKLRLRP